MTTVLDQSSESLIPVRQLKNHLPTPVTTKTIYSWISRGVAGVRLPFVKVGGRTFIRRSDFDAFAERLSQRTPTIPTETPRHRNRRKDERQAEAERRLEREGF